MLKKFSIKNNYLNHLSQKEKDNFEEIKNTEIIKLKLNIIKYTKEFKKHTSSYFKSLERLDKLISISKDEIQQTYRKRKNEKIRDMNNDKVKKIIVNLINTKTDLNKIRDEFKKMGIIFTKDKSKI